MNTKIMNLPPKKQAGLNIYFRDLCYAGADQARGGGTRTQKKDEGCLMNINQVWPEWNEDCVLGEGSFGKVYRAKRMEYGGRTFYSAIKVISVPKNQQEIKAARSQGMDDQAIYNYFRGLVDNLLNEITLMDNLKGAKNIVGIEDYKIIEREGEIGWDLFIRMELLTPFDSFVSNPEFSQLDVIRLGVDICTALEACEQNCIVHRDIKPDNIFISRFGEYKLGDFGIARKLEATQANLSRKGTLNYMAPEVYKSEAYGSNVDIYSLGLVMYTLLNNNRVAFLPPYPQQITYKDNEEALSKRLSGVPLTPPCNASASLGAAIVKACAYYPQDRYQTATEFKNALIAEWNVLVQSGENREIRSDVSRFSDSMGYGLQNTTNDMTANGRLVAGDYLQGTTVLEQGYGGASSQQSPMNDTYVPASYSTAKSNKVCRVLAWPMALALCALAIWMEIDRSLSLLEQMVSFALLGTGAAVILADRNKLAVGVCVAALSLGYIVEGAFALFGGLQATVPIQAIVTSLSGLLMLFSGIVIISQKEVRFGGSLALYALIVEWLYHIYGMINKSFAVATWHIFFGVAAISVFVWAYGYNSDDKPTGIKKIFHIVAYVLAAVMAIRAIAFLAAAIPVIFIKA